MTGLLARVLVLFVLIFLMIFAVMAVALLIVRGFGASITAPEATVLAALVSVVVSAFGSPLLGWLLGKYGTYPLPPHPLKTVKWERIIPLERHISQETRERATRVLKELLGDVERFVAGRGVTSYQARANILLPNPYPPRPSDFPGQLAFHLTYPQGSYEPTELSNQFSPGEGVSGKVFLQGNSFGERGRFGVSEEKFELMPPTLVYVIGYALKLDDSPGPFGVVCIDFLSKKRGEAKGELTQDEETAFRAVVDMPAVWEKVNEVAAILSYKEHPAFKLSITARVP